MPRYDRYHKKDSYCGPGSYTLPYWLVGDHNNRVCYAHDRDYARAEKRGYSPYVGGAPEADVVAAKRWKGVTGYGMRKIFNVRDAVLGVTGQSRPPNNRKRRRSDYSSFEKNKVVKSFRKEEEMPKRSTAMVPYGHHKKHKGGKPQYNENEGSIKTFKKRRSKHRKGMSSKMYRAVKKEILNILSPPKIYKALFEYTFPGSIGGEASSVIDMSTYVYSAGSPLVRGLSHSSGMITTFGATQTAPVLKQGTQWYLENRVERWKFYVDSKGPCIITFYELEAKDDNYYPPLCYYVQDLQTAEVWRGDTGSGTVGGGALYNIRTGSGSLGVKWYIPQLGTSTGVSVGSSITQLDISKQLTIGGKQLGHNVFNKHWKVHKYKKVKVQNEHVVYDIHHGTCKFVVGSLFGGETTLVETAAANIPVYMYRKGAKVLLVRFDFELYGGTSTEDAAQKGAWGNGFVTLTKSEFCRSILPYGGDDNMTRLAFYQAQAQAAARPQMDGVNEQIQFADDS